MLATVPYEKGHADALAGMGKGKRFQEELRNTLRSNALLNSLEQDVESSLGAIIGVAGTLAAQRLASWLRRPKIEVMFDDSKPRYHQVTSSRDEGGKTLWTRFEVQNTGKSAAELEAKLISVKNLDSGKEIERFYPVHLQCVSEEGKTNFQLVRGESEVVGLVHKNESEPKSMVVSTEAGHKSMGRQLTFEASRYLLTIGIYGTKIEPVFVKFIAENGAEFSSLKIERYQEPSILSRNLFLNRQIINPAMQA